MRDVVHDVMHPNSTVAYQQGFEGNRVLFVFESPGKLEYELNRPVVGNTGVHLCILCERIRSKAAKSKYSSVQDISRDICKQTASILNISAVSLPKKSADQLNKEERRSIAEKLIARKEFQELLQSALVVICFGRLAWDMGDIIESKLNDCGNNYKIIYTYHLSSKASRNFEGSTWPEKMTRLASRIVHVFEDEGRRISDFTNFEKKYKRLPVQPKE